MRGSRPGIMLFVLTNEYKAAGDARIGARRALCERSALMGLLRSCFARTQTWLQAGKYLNALVSDLPSRNGGTVGEQGGGQTPARGTAGGVRGAGGRGGGVRVRGGGRGGGGGLVVPAGGEEGGAGGGGSNKNPRPRRPPRGAF